MSALYNNKPAIYGLSINSFVFDEKLIDAMPSLRAQKIRSYRFKDDRKRSFAVELLLEEVLGKDAAFRVCQYDTGKPYIEDGPSFSVSHSGDWVVLAVCSKPVGIDIERINTSRDTDGIARRVFHPDERAQAPGDIKMFYKIWTAKESYIKMLGNGLTSLPGFHVKFINGEECAADDGSVIRLFDNIYGYAAAVCSPKGIDWPDKILVL
ncbi:MAG: 4'-phosphopantetheinyl transferase superfamily protein [Spirochaetaceae bacterium]|jgi:4'-phosphopantetheinyl transferase|nr:4'-phosphopantetheinyl transferase superfamily protein [Spirochaetaceae bacterium]